MRKLFYLLILLPFLACNNSGTKGTSNNGDGLDLKAVGELAKTCKDAQDFENKLNQKDGINNLDIDGDGNVDYISVKGYNDGDVKGFSLIDDLGNGNKQEVATVEITKKITPADSTKNSKSDTNINVTVTGNKDVYNNNNGNNNISYTSTYPSSDFLLYYWMFSPRYSLYSSPYYYGYYPSYYHHWGCVPYSSYSRRIVVHNHYTTINNYSSHSPNRNMGSKQKYQSNPTHNSSNHSTSHQSSYHKSGRR